MAIHSPKELEGCGHELKFEDTASCIENRIQMPHSLFPSFIPLSRQSNTATSPLKQISPCPQPHGQKTRWKWLRRNRCEKRQTTTSSSLTTF